MKCSKNVHWPFVWQKMSTMKRRVSEDILICEELNVILTQCDYTNRKVIVWRCRCSNTGPTLAETRQVWSTGTPLLSLKYNLRLNWLVRRGGSSWLHLWSAVMLDFYRQVKPPVHWETSRVSSGLRCKPLNDPPVVFNNDLVTLLQLFVLRSSVHLTHVGHQLLWAEALLHLRQLPLILLHTRRPNGSVIS